jgi:Phenazine biosynthesis-like protein
MQPLDCPLYLPGLLGTRPLAYWGSALGYRVALLAADHDLNHLASPAAQLEGPDRQGLVLMQALGNEGPEVFGQPCHYQLRFFAPGLGIPEDPVTGSAHALVAPWWMQQLGADQVRGWQCSPRRGGMLCELVQAGLIRLSGTGHCLWNGQLQAGPSGRDPDGWRPCGSI